MEDGSSRRVFAVMLLRAKQSIDDDTTSSDSIMHRGCISLQEVGWAVGTTWDLGWWPTSAAETVFGRHVEEVVEQRRSAKAKRRAAGTVDEFWNAESEGRDDRVGSIRIA